MISGNPPSEKYQYQPCHNVTDSPLYTPGSAPAKQHHQESSVNTAKSGSTGPGTAWAVGVEVVVVCLAKNAARAWWPSPTLSQQQ